MVIYLPILYIGARLALIFILITDVVMNNHSLDKTSNTASLKLIPRIKIAWRKHMDILRLLIRIAKFSLEWLHHLCCLKILQPR